jgi:hypothetical protein
MPAVNEQPDSPRRFTVIELPVLSIVKESLLLPLKCVSELVRFGGRPLLLIIAVDVLCYGLQRQDISRSLTGGLMGIAHFLLFTPFSVAWTKLAIRGRQAVVNHPAFAYSRTQLLYLLAIAVMMAALVVLVGIPYVVLRYGQRNFDNEIATLSETAIAMGLGVFLIGYVRLAFVFPAIAIGRYAGIGAVWKQTAGNLERLAAILVLANLPYWIVRQAFDWYMGYHPPGVIEAFHGCIDMLLVALATTAVAGPALAYKAIVLDQPQNEIAAPSISSVR